MPKHSIVIPVMLIFIATAAHAAGPATRPTTAPADPGAIVVPDVKYDRNAISDALEDLRDVSGAPIYVDWDHFTASGINRDSRVSGHFKQKPVSAVIAELFKQAAKGKPAPVVETVDGVVTVATPARIRHMKALIAAQPAPPRDGDPVPAIYRKLPLIAFDQTGLADVFSSLADMTGMKIDVDWDALAKAGITKETPVSFKSADEPLAEALLSILFDTEPENFELSYKVTGDTIRITATKDK